MAKADTTSTPDPKNAGDQIPTPAPATNPDVQPAIPTQENAPVQSSFEAVNNAQAANFMPNNIAGGVPTATVPTPQLEPVHVVQVPPLQSQVENITATGGQEFSLQGTPVRIDSVTVNGQPFSLGIVGQHATTAANQVLYDLEKGALVFGQDIQGLIQVAYQQAPQMEKALEGGVVAWLHNRLVDVENLLERLKGSHFL